MPLQSTRRLAESSERRGLRAVITKSKRGEDRPVADDVGVAANRRGEVAVVLKPQAAVAKWLSVVPSLLKGTQHERADPEAPALLLAGPVLNEHRRLRRDPDCV